MRWREGKPARFNRPIDHIYRDISWKGSDSVGISWNKSCVVGSMSRILVITPVRPREHDKSRELRKYAVSELAGSSTLLVFMTQIGCLASSGMCGVDVPVLIGVFVLFNLGVDWVWCADLKFESLNFSIDVVLASIRGGRFVYEIEKDDDKDEGRGKRIEHERVEIAR
jgi:hypothetical protein